jgi:hypothetical protein
MGTALELYAGNVSLSYSKNSIGEDFGVLFQEGDIAHRQQDQVDYDYYEAHPGERGDLLIAEEVFARKLLRIVPRLEMLGFTLQSARDEYEALVAEAISLANSDQEVEGKANYLSFDEFCKLISRHPLSSLKKEYIPDESPEQEILRIGRFASDIKQISRLPVSHDFSSYWSEASYFAHSLCILSPQSMLQIFAQVSQNADVEVIWAFGPIVHAGWVQRDVFQPGAQKRERILVAIEGASDARIIQRAIGVLRPEVADFFNFVDVNEKHHFWGAGNLVKFAEGLLRIEILNKVLFVFDNDAEGVDALRRIEKLQLPLNLRAMVLPSLDEFKQFATRGPDGTRKSDINGRAAGIECYLDLRLDQQGEPKVTWNNYKKEIDAWQGVLDSKDEYSKHFYNQSDTVLRSGDYDTSKLAKLVDALILQSAMIVPML